MTFLGIVLVVLLAAGFVIDVLIWREQRRTRRARLILRGMRSRYRTQAENDRLRAERRDRP